MNELHLFAGCGGGVLAGKLLGWRSIGYVEREPYRCRILERRIRDRILCDAPVYRGDVRDFIDNGYAALYRGLVDVLAGGFPCPPFSLAGRQLAGLDPRNAWPETRECIQVVKPRACWLENVPGLITSPYLKTVVGDLRELGYRVRATVLGGVDLGAPHIRKRLWILGYAEQDRTAPGIANPAARQEGQAAKPHDASDVLNPNQTGRTKQRRSGANGQEHAPAQRPGSALPDADAVGFQRGTDQQRQRAPGGGRSGEHDQEAGALSNSAPGGLATNGCSPGQAGHLDELCAPLSNPESVLSGTGLCEAGAERDGHELANLGRPGPRSITWWDVEPGMGRMADGVAHHVDRLEALGDGQIPAVAAAAWLHLTRDLKF